MHILALARPSKAASMLQSHKKLLSYKYAAATQTVKQLQKGSLMIAAEQNVAIADDVLLWKGLSS